VALQLATTAFHDALTRQVLGEGLLDARADGRPDAVADGATDDTTDVNAPRR
jgi:hypothetical protein